MRLLRFFKEQLTLIVSGISEGIRLSKSYKRR
jgi:hypothetical protein